MHSNRPRLSFAPDLVRSSLASSRAFRIFEPALGRSGACLKRHFAGEQPRREAGLLAHCEGSRSAAPGATTSSSFSTVKGGAQFAHHAIDSTDAKS